jgi:hypothetical protein
MADAGRRAFDLEQARQGVLVAWSSVIDAEIARFRAAVALEGAGRAGDVAALAEIDQAVARLRYEGRRARRRLRRLRGELRRLRSGGR